LASKLMPVKCSEPGELFSEHSRNFRRVCHVPTVRLPPKDDTNPD
jgi:hypothetical protein